MIGCCFNRGWTARLMQWKLKTRRLHNTVGHCSVSTGFTDCRLHSSITHGLSQVCLIWDTTAYPKSCTCDMYTQEVIWTLWTQPLQCNFNCHTPFARRLDNKDDIEDLFDPLLQFCNRFCSWAIPGPNQLVLPFTAACRQVQSELAPMSHVGQTGAGETGQTGPYVPGRVLTGVKPAKARTWQKPLPPGAAPRQAQAVFLRILGDYCLCYGPKGGCTDFLEIVGALVFEWFWIFQLDYWLWLPWARNF